jgi:nucleotidyltransferase/DNA polymerase involved in DNA repair
VPLTQEMRRLIFERTKLTASAGVACNRYCSTLQLMSCPCCHLFLCGALLFPCRMLAKICSDQNKPNGQYVLPNTHAAVQQFMETLPVRKVPGVGQVCTHRTPSRALSSGNLTCAVTAGDGEAAVCARSEHVRGAAGRHHARPAPPPLLRGDELSQLIIRG